MDTNKNKSEFTKQFLAECALHKVNKIGYAVNLGIKEMVKNHRLASATQEQKQLLETANA